MDNEIIIAQAINYVRLRVFSKSLLRLQPSGAVLAQRIGKNIHCHVYQDKCGLHGIIRPNGHETWEAA